MTVGEEWAVWTINKMPGCTKTCAQSLMYCLGLNICKFISCFPVGYREISMKIFLDLALVPPVKIPIFMFLLPRLIGRASQPDGNMMSFILHFLRLT